MKRIYLSFIVLLLTTAQVFAQSDCSSAIVICGNTQTFNPSGIGNKLEQLACGGIEHNSVWLAFQAKASGKLNFVIRTFTVNGLPTAADFDWSLYALPGNPNTSNCNNKVGISCNFSGTSTVFGIPGATGMASPPYASAAFNPGIDVSIGNWYMLMADQFSNTVPLLFTVQFTGNPESPHLNSTPGIFDNEPDFSVNNNAGCNGIFSFSNGSVATSGVAGSSWNFGDGSTSTVANPTHTYATPGTYYVTLTSTDVNGCKSDIRKTVVYNNTAPTVNTAGILLLPSCSDANNGSITVSTIGATTPGVTGGTPPYQFELISPSPVIRPLQSSNLFSNLQPGGYTIKVTDACGKSATGSVTINQVITNSTIGLGIQNIQSSCQGSATGSATLFANGTTPPYTMALVNTSPVLAAPQTAVIRDPVTATYYVTFNSLLPGVYTLEATDGCNKIRRATFTVTASTAPIANTIASASCASSPTGTLSVTTTAATGLSGAGSPGVFQYALIAPSPVTRPFQNSSVFENLWPGTYTIAVKDACGNVGTANSNIVTAAAPTLAAFFTTTSCPGGSTGTIETQIASAGGGSPYTFELIAPSPVVRSVQADNTFANLPPGVYTVRVADACGATVTGSVTVGAASAPSFTTTITTSCNSSASGTILVAPSTSAIGPFTFELISPGAAIRTSQPNNVANTSNSIFTGLNQGNYTVRMTDGCMVPVTAAVSIAAPSALVFPLGSTTIPSCAGSSTGRIIVAVPITGQAAYKYELIAPSQLTAAPQYSRIFDNLPAGSYTVRITDSCGAQVTIGAELTVGVSTAPTLSATNTSSCAINSGTITALATTANQGGGTYQYALIAPSPVTRPNQTAPTFTGLPSGAYTVQITDQCGLTGTTNTTITAAGAFSPAAGGSIVACNGTGYYGQIIVTNPQNYTVGGPIPPGSGGGPYSYALYDAGNTTLIAGPQSSNIFANVTAVAGTPSHTVRVTDVCGNTSTTTVTINLPATLTNAIITATTSSCSASATGVIKVTTVASGGLTPYRYSLVDAITAAVVAGPQTSTIFNGIAANATGYFVRVTDACGNVNTSASPLLFPAAATPTATAVTVASCTSPATGRIIVTPGTGATLAGGTFGYALYDAANTLLIAGPQASPSFSNIAAGNYTVRITDVCGVTGTLSVTVASGAAALTATAIASGSCTAGSNGVITGSFTGGSLPVTYSLILQPGAVLVSGPQVANIFTGLAPNTYAIRVTDACGTQATSSDIVVGTLTAAPTITTSTAIDCSGSALLAGFGGGGSGGPYTYAICNGSACNTFGAYATTSTFTVNTSGTYVISVQDRCGNAVSSPDIVVNIPVKATISNVSKSSVCGSTNITISFGSVPNTAYYSVDGANFAATTGLIAPGCHTIRVADFNGGTFGCASDAFSFNVFELPSITQPSAVNVNCGTGSVIIPATGGNTGCIGTDAEPGIKLTACTGCTPQADAIGTIQNIASAFALGGATQASFVPVVRVGGIEICSGASLSVDFSAICAGPIPVRIEYFIGSKQGNSHILDWKVSANTSNATLILERSSDSRSFTALYTVTADLVQMSSPFTYINNNVLNGINYYRLKMTDANGVINYSQIVSLNNTSKGYELISIAPNPVTNGTFKLNISSAELLEIEIVITDIAGRPILKQNSSLFPGFNAIQMNVNNLAAGVYQVYGISKEGKTSVLSFVIP